MNFNLNWNIKEFDGSDSGQHAGKLLGNALSMSNVNPIEKIAAWGRRLRVDGILEIDQIDTDVLIVLLKTSTQIPLTAECRAQIYEFFEAQKEKQKT